MKKFGKLLIAGLLVGGLTIPLAGCVDPEPFVPPEGGGNKVIINDAYDWNEDETGSTRPDLGGGYVPAPPAKEATLKLASGSKIKFAGCKTELILPAGDLLTQEHFDSSTLNGLSVGGVAVLDEEGNIVEVHSLEDFVAQAEITVMPFYAVSAGKTLLFGSNTVGDYVRDAEFNEISESVEIAKSVSVNDGWLNTKVDVTGTLEKDSSFRTLTTFAIPEGYDFTYSYKFTNYGDSEISFTVYQMRSGYRWDNPAINVEAGTVTLAPGASSDVLSAKVTSSSAGENALTLIKLNGTVENLSLGVSMAAQDNTVQSPAKITLKLPEGVSVAEDYVTDVTTFEKLVLPTGEQITNESGMGEIKGWYDTATGKPVNNSTTILRSMTIAPYWQNVDGYNFINIGSGSNSGYNTDEVPGDMHKHTSNGTGSFSYLGSVNGTSRAYAVTNGNGYAVQGAVISDNLPVQAGSMLRFDSKRTAGAGVYEMNITVANYGTSNLHLSVYHINASSDYKSGGGWYRYETQRHRVDIQLKPGESISKLGQFDFTGQTNGNWLTLIVFEEDTDSFSFGFAESYKQVDSYDSTTYPAGNLLNKNVTIAYDKEANGGIKVNESYLTKRVGRFITAPSASEIEVPEDVILVGWKIVLFGKEYDLPATRKNYNDLQIPSSGATLKAVFSKISKTPVNITAAEVDGFELSQDYLNKEIFVGGYFTVPEEGEYTNTTGLPIIGWKDKTTGETLTNSTFITSENIVLEPIFAEAVNVTLQLPDGVTVSGFKTQQAKDNKLVLPEAGQITLPANMGEITGWYNVATKAFVTADTVLTADIAIAPYWLTAKDYTQIQLGSGANWGYNTQEVPGDLMKYAGSKGGSGLEYYGYNSGGSSTKNGDAQILVGGDYALLGSVLLATKPVRAGSAIRFDTKRTAGAGKYEFTYTIVNNGTTDLLLSIYQINASSEYRSSTYYGYESRYRTEIRVAAGETVTALGQYDLGSNTNWMTYIVFEKDVDSFSFGIAAGYKAITEIADEFKNQPALNNPANISYDPAANSGIVVKDSYLKQRAGKFALAPTAADIENPDNLPISKWQIVIGGTTYDLPASTSSYTNVQIPSSGATLKVVLAEPVTVTLQTNNGVSVEGAKTSYYTGQKLELPALTATTTDVRTHAGWYNTATGAIVTNDTIVESAMTLAPYFAPAATALTPLSGAKNTEVGCAYGPDNLSSTSLNGNFTKAVGVGGDEAGIILGYNGSLAANDAFRFKTSFGVQAKTYTYTINFTNYGTEEVKFTVYQVASGTTTTGMPSQEVTLAAGASTTAELTITYTGTNGNALTYFVMGGSVNNMSLGISMSVAEATA